jgi:NAD(P)-dependent dehydrogenase (short-subunit alcohol dehydrogenase family)
MSDADLGLDGRVVIVTGAGQGLGRAYARRFAAVGAKVVVAELDGKKGRDVGDEIADAGGDVLVVPTDVASPGSVGQMVAATLERYGRIDGLVNNAAIATVLGRRFFTEIPLDEWDAVMQVNVKGTFLCARAVVPAMIKAGWGRIVNISSTTVIMGRVNMLHYVASKAAVLGLTRSLAREVGGFGITVNTVLPGLTPHETHNPGWTSEGIAMIKAMQCIPRLETPEDLTEMVLFLLSEGSRFITGQSIAVDGGAVHI